MKTALLVLTTLFLGSESFAQTSPYYIETVEVAPKGTRAQQDQNLGDLYNGPGSKPANTQQTNESGYESSAPIYQQSSSRSAYEVYGYETAFEMRSRRRIGIGLATSGQTGLYGATLELNVTPENSAVLGFGGGPQYSAFSAQWKHLFGGKNISPYSSLGYARWYNASGQSGSVSKSKPTPLASKFLSNEEKRTGKFSVNLFTPAVGLQFNQLAGPYTGTSFFAEIVVLMELESFQQAPVGSLGVLYYF